MVLPGRFELPFAASETAALSIELRELNTYYITIYVFSIKRTITYKPNKNQTLSTFDLQLLY